MQVTSGIGLPPTISCESNKEISPPSNGFFDRILAAVLNCFAWIKNFCFTYPTLTMSVVAVVLCTSVMILRKQPIIEIFSALFNIILIPVFKTFLKMGATSQVKEKKVEEYEEGIEVSFVNDQVKIESNFFIDPIHIEADVRCFLKSVIAFTYREYHQQRLEISANKKVISEVLPLAPKKFITKIFNNHEPPFLRIDVLSTFYLSQPQEFLDPILKIIQESALFSFNNYKKRLNQPTQPPLNVAPIQV